MRAMARGMLLAAVMTSGAGGCVLMLGLDDKTFDGASTGGGPGSVSAGGAGGAGNAGGAGGAGGGTGGGLVCGGEDAMDDDSLWAVNGATAAVQKAGGVAAGANGDVWLVGSFEGSLQIAGATLDGGGGETGFWMRLDGCGVPLQSQAIVPEGATVASRVNAVATDAMGNAVIVGQFWGQLPVPGGPLDSGVDPDLLVMKLDAAGSVLWGWTAEGSFAKDEALAVALDPDGSVVVGGTFQDALDIGLAMPLAGHAASLEGFVVKLSSEGTPLWGASVVGTSGDDVVRAVAVADDHRIGVAGFIAGTATAVGTSGAEVLAGIDVDAFAGVMYADGVWAWAHEGGDASYALGYAVAFDPDGANLFVAGEYADADFGFNTMEPLQAPVGPSGFVAKIPVLTGETSVILPAPPTSGSGNSYVSALAIDEETGHLLLGGGMNLDMSLLGQTLQAPGTEHAFVARVEQDLATLRYAKAFGHDMGMGSRTAAVAADRQVGATLATGTFSGTVSFGLPNALESTQPSIFLLKAMP